MSKALFHVFNGAKLKVSLTDHQDKYQKQTVEVDLYSVDNNFCAKD